MVALGNTFGCNRINCSFGGGIKMKEKMSKERIIISVMCLLFLIMGFSLLLGFRDAQECMGNPFVYGANKIVTDNKDTGGLYCSCSFGSYKYAGFDFNEDSLDIRKETFAG